MKVVTSSAAVNARTTPHGFWRFAADYLLAARAAAIHILNITYSTHQLRYIVTGATKVPQLVYIARSAKELVLDSNHLAPGSEEDWTMLSNSTLLTDAYAPSYRQSLNANTPGRL